MNHTEYILRLELHPLIHNWNYTTRDTKEKYIYHYPDPDAALMKLYSIPDEAFRFDKAKEKQLSLYIDAAAIIDTSTGQILMEKKWLPNEPFTTTTDFGLLKIVTGENMTLAELQSQSAKLFKTPEQEFAGRFPFVLETRELGFEGSNRFIFYQNDMRFHASLRDSLRQLSKLNINRCDPSVLVNEHRTDFLYGWQIKRHVSNEVLANLLNNTYLPPIRQFPGEGIYLVTDNYPLLTQEVPELDVFGPQPNKTKLLIATYDVLHSGITLTQPYQQLIENLGTKEEKLTRKITDSNGRPETTEQPKKRI